MKDAKVIANVETEYLVGYECLRNVYCDCHVR